LFHSETKPEQQSQPVTSERARFSGFRVGSREPEAGYQLDPAQVMSMVSADAPADYAGRFAELAAREHVMRMLRSPAARAAIKRGHDYQGGLAIQL
jgi:hypothetical protein